MNTMIEINGLTRFVKLGDDVLFDSEPHRYLLAELTGDKAIARLEDDPVRARAIVGDLYRKYENKFDMGLLTKIGKTGMVMIGGNSDQFGYPATNSPEIIKIRGITRARFSVLYPGNEFIMVTR